MRLRSDSEKSDLAASWQRADRSFFASGACHILSHAFLLEYPVSGYRPIYILPQPGIRGCHVLVSDGTEVFDYHGYSGHDRYVAHYHAKMHRFFPGWQGDLIPIEESLVGDGFCSRFNHRLPTQYFSEPVPRAKKYLAHFQAPRAVCYSSPSRDSFSK